MKRAALLLFLIATPALAQEKGIRFPEIVPESTPVAVSRLDSDRLYVIDSDIPIFLKLIQDGLVTVTEETGPIRIRGKFVDGTKYETRLFKGKQIFILEAAGTGALDLLVIPVGVTKASEILHKKLEVDAGGAPDPKPKPPPDDPKVGLVAHCSFVGATPDSVSVVNSKEIRDYLKANGIKGWVFVANDPKMPAGFDSVINRGGLPLIVLQDAKGNVVAAARMSNVAENFQWLKTQVGK